MALSSTGLRSIPRHHVDVDRFLSTGPLAQAIDESITKTSLLLRSGRSGVTQDTRELSLERLAVVDSRLIGMLQVKSTMDLVQDTIQGTFAQGCDSVLAVTMKLFAHWDLCTLRSVCTHPRHTSLLTSGCKLSFLLMGSEVENLRLLSALCKQSGKQRCAEFCDVACKFTAA